MSYFRGTISVSFFNCFQANSKPPSVGGSVTFKKPILASLILLYLIDLMIHIKILPVSYRVSVRCFHNNITPFAKIQNAWHPDYRCHFNSDTSTVIQLRFVSHCRGVCVVDNDNNPTRASADWYFRYSYQLIYHTYQNHPR